jgi:NAD+ kinase
MKIAVHGKKLVEENQEHIKELFSDLQKRDVDLIISEPFLHSLHKFGINTAGSSVYKKGENLKDVDLLISLGGDGTLLESVTHVGKLETPILGINTGRLGFLATTPKTNIKGALDALFKKSYHYDSRALIKLESDKDLFEGLNFGLNEFTILKKDTSSMIVVHTFINGEYLNSYWADGLIVATPTGSTGYSLSCGGPVVLPQSNNFIITPVSPHNLNVRPLIVSDKSVISFEIEGRSKNYLVSLDSRSRTVDASIQMAVRKEDFRAKLIRLNGYNFLDTLRNKLNWGLDSRN